jgi:hypothetical protein
MSPTPSAPPPIASSAQRRAAAWNCRRQLILQNRCARPPGPPRPERPVAPVAWRGSGRDGRCFMVSFRRQAAGSACARLLRRPSKPRIGRAVGEPQLHPLRVLANCRDGSRPAQPRCHRSFAFVGRLGRFQSLICSGVTARRSKWISAAGAIARSVSSIFSPALTPDGSKSPR